MKMSENTAPHLLLSDHVEEFSLTPPSTETEDQRIKRVNSEAWKKMQARLKGFCI